MRFSRDHDRRPATSVAAVAAYAVVVLGVVDRHRCRSRRCSTLLTIPLALQVSRGLEPNYDNPYGLMAIMGVNIKLHLVAGLALVAAYLVVLVVQAVAPSVPLFLG